VTVVGLLLSLVSSKPIGLGIKPKPSAVSHRLSALQLDCLYDCHPERRRASVAWGVEGSAVRRQWQEPIVTAINAFPDQHSVKISYQPLPREKQVPRLRSG
jgi:hypothetical protein